MDDDDDGRWRFHQYLSAVDNRDLQRQIADEHLIMQAAIALAEWRLMIGDNDNESSIDKVFCTSHASICRSICAIRMSSTIVNDCHSIDDKWHDTLNDNGTIICDRLVDANRSSSGTSDGRISNKPPLASTMSYCVFCYNNSRFSYEKLSCKIGVAKPDPNDATADWSNHRCKDDRGNVVCPVLFAHRCGTCGASGRNSHTDRYCPVRQQKKFIDSYGNKLRQ